MSTKICSKEFLKAVFWASLDQKGLFDKLTKFEKKALAKKANDDKYGLNIALDYAHMIIQMELDEREKKNGK